MIDKPIRQQLLVAALLSGAATLVFPSLAFGLSELDVQDLMQNLRGVLVPATGLLLAISFVMGIIFLMRGLLLLKAFSQPLTQATRPGEIGGPLVYIVVGAVLIYIPTSTDVLSNTLFGQVDSIFPGARGGGSFAPKFTDEGADNLMGYKAPASIEGHWATMVDTIVQYVQFIGFIAFLRGWMLIAHAGQPGVQPGSITKGLIHVIGGILAINFLPLVRVIHNTLVG